MDNFQKHNINTYLQRIDEHTNIKIQIRNALKHNKRITNEIVNSIRKQYEIYMKKKREFK